MGCVVCGRGLSGDLIVPRGFGGILGGIEGKEARYGVIGFCHDPIIARRRREVQWRCLIISKTMILLEKGYDVWYTIVVEV
jgi:hypothetical protein